MSPSSVAAADGFHRLRVPADSPLTGRSAAQMQKLYDDAGVVLVGVERRPHRKTRFLPALPETVCEPNDIIIVVGSQDEVLQLIESQHLIELPRLDEAQRAEALQEIGAAEVMLAPESKLIGKTLGELEFRSRFHVSVLAIRHRGERVTANLGKQTLDFGDTLLVAGAWADIRRLWADDRDFVMLTLPGEYHELLPAPVAIGILIVNGCGDGVRTLAQFR
jgi:K+/H+ antiporter YhaU regulatory subunit KhtT